MNVREVFQEELRQMTRVAACSRYRRGRERRGCSLPSDTLSNEQIRLLCGPVRVFRGGVEVTEGAAECGNRTETAECGNRTETAECGNRTETASGDGSLCRSEPD